MMMNLDPRRMRVRALSLQTKIICLVILFVAFVLFLSSYLDSKLSQQAFENDLRDQTVSLAQELAASIAVPQIIGAPDTLNKEIEVFKAIRKDLHSLDVFLSSPRGPVLTASTQGSSRAAPKPEVWSRLQEGRVTTVLERLQRPRTWEVTAPIWLKGEIVGAIRVRSSLENADRLAERERDVSPFRS